MSFSYTEKLGDVLVEIHNDLMIPLPQALREYSLEKEAEDSFFNGSVRSDLPASTGPFSLVSSDESRDSVDFRPNKKYCHAVFTIAPCLLMNEIAKIISYRELFSYSYYVERVGFSLISKTLSFLQFCFVETTYKKRHLKAVFRLTL